ncbi:MAG: penicillin-binding protein 2 [Anaerolineaceae bacterium]|jgi:penicillin-binding protein 2
MIDLEKRTSHELNPWRMRILYLIIAIILAFFLAKLFDIQILEGSAYTAQANDNRTSVISVSTQRGVIYDRNGYVLARNIASYNVTITPANLPEDSGAVQEIYRQVSNLTGVPVTNGVVTEEVARTFTPCQTDLGITEIVSIQDSIAPYTAVDIKCNVDQTVAMTINEHAHDWPGVSIEVKAVRDYPTGSLTADVVGFLGPIPAAEEKYYNGLGFISGTDKVGYAGVEQSEQDILGGKNGQRTVEVDAAGQILGDLAAPVAAIPGENIELTIDTRLQAAAQAALVYSLNYWDTWFNDPQKMTKGVVIAMNPKTGEILAMVSWPTYENNRMARLIPAYYYAQLSQDPNKPLFNNAISGEFPPGSVFKMAAATGALNENVVTPDQKLFDPGSITISLKYSQNETGTQQVLYNWDRTGLGWLDFIGGVANSDDVYFYKIGGGFGTDVPNGGLGIWRLGEYAKVLGYARQTGIELPGEATGLIPDPTWKRINQSETWSTGDTYIATIGQGYVLATPLQVLMSYQTIINDGKMMKPTIIHRILDQNGNVIQDFQPQEVWDITKDPLIAVLDANNQPTGQMKVVQPWVIAETKTALRAVVTEGTAVSIFDPGGKEMVIEGQTIESAGKTGSAEYCDNIAQAKNLCIPDNWPVHAWYVGYAPYTDPEIAILAFVYNGGEGATVAAPIVKSVMEAYFELKYIDSQAAK